MMAQNDLVALDIEIAQSQLVALSALMNLALRIQSSFALLLPYFVKLS